jgi:hypothetical protein
MVSAFFFGSHSCDEKGKDIIDIATFRTLPAVTEITENTAVSGGIVDCPDRFTMLDEEKPEYRYDYNCKTGPGPLYSAMTAVR